MNQMDSPGFGSPLLPSGPCHSDSMISMLQWLKAYHTFCPCWDIKPHPIWAFPNFFWLQRGASGNLWNLICDRDFSYILTLILNIFFARFYFIPEVSSVRHNHEATFLPSLHHPATSELSWLAEMDAFPLDKKMKALLQSISLVASSTTDTFLDFLCCAVPSVTQAR